MVYYNEIDPFAVAWLRELIACGVVADGIVDTRPIQEVEPIDLEGYTQHHFFAGIGGWSYALRLAGWSDDTPVWTGSCPCQPFSAAGQQKGFDDSRHLWPVWFRLIAECQPPIVFGEQVASALQWLDLVSGNMEGEDYAFGAAVLGAHSVGAPHIRQRLYFVADHDYEGPRVSTEGESAGELEIESGDDAVGCRAHDGLAKSKSQQQHGRGHTRRGRGESADDGLMGPPERARLQRQPRHVHDGDQSGWLNTHASRSTAATGSTGELAHPGRQRRQQESRSASRDEVAHGRRAEGNHQSAGDGENYWTPCDWLPCQDGKYRPVEPGTFPLAHGISARVGRLRGYGNSIVPQTAAAFISAYKEIRWQ